MRMRRRRNGVGDEPERAARAGPRADGVRRGASVLRDAAGGVRARARRGTPRARRLDVDRAPPARLRPEDRARHLSGHRLHGGARTVERPGAGLPGQRPGRDRAPRAPAGSRRRGDGAGIPQRDPGLDPDRSLRQRRCPGTRGAGRVHPVALPGEGHRHAPRLPPGIPPAHRATRDGPVAGGRGRGLRRRPDDVRACGAAPPDPAGPVRGGAARWRPPLLRAGVGRSRPGGSGGGATGHGRNGSSERPSPSAAAGSPSTRRSWSRISAPRRGRPRPGPPTGPSPPGPWAGPTAGSSPEACRSGRS